MMPRPQSCPAAALALGRSAPRADSLSEAVGAAARTEATIAHCSPATIVIQAPDFTELRPIVILNRFAEIAFKDPPPPYRANDNAESNTPGDQITGGPHCEVLDLLANCKVTDEQDTPEYAEIGDMGIWHSTPLAHRHKSKISLTWVLKENLENAKIPDKFEDQMKSVIGSDLDRRKCVNERYRKCKSQVNRVVGRNEYYHNMRFRSACEELVKGGDSCSDSSEELSRKRHKHRHRRKKKPRQRFGYDIKDLDSFLTEASIDRPGNIPVVIAYPSTLYQTHKECQREVSLPLGTVVNAVFKNEHWLYAQTPHGAEGYVLYAACLPLPILPNRSSPQKKTPCWESSTDIYPRPCGNLTDNEKEQLRGRTHSECRYRRAKKHCAERDFDSLYLRTKSVSNIDKIGNESLKLYNSVKKNPKFYNIVKESPKLYNSVKESPKLYNSGKEIPILYRSDQDSSLLYNSVKESSKLYIRGKESPKLYNSVKDIGTKRQTLLVVTSDFNGADRTLSVQKGDVVVLVQRGETDVDAEWFYVRKRDGSQGFIPAAIAGNGYI